MLTFNNLKFKIKNFKNSLGQTLLEVIVVITVGVIIIGALVFTTISSLRNASTAKNDAQATKLAQEGLEKVRAIRDRNGNISGGGFPADSWADPDLWSGSLSANICVAPQGCFFKISFADLNYLGAYQSPPTGGETLGNFTRYIILSDDANFADWKEVTALVTWIDFAGTHESRMKTILRKL